jgi:TRAP-type mannitol/chloroaromatic compound transport system permease small subunit
LRFSRLIDALNERMGTVASWCVLIACLISAGNAFGRYTFSAGSNAWLEIQWYLFSAMFLLGASYTLKLNGHVRVDVMYGHVSRRAQLWIDLLGAIFFMLPATIMLCWLSWPIFYNSFALGEMSANPGGLIRWPVKLLLPVGFGFLTLQGFSQVIKLVAEMIGSDELDATYEKPVQ